MMMGVFSINKDTDTVDGGIDKQQVTIWGINQPW